LESLCSQGIPKIGFSGVCRMPFRCSIDSQSNVGAVLCALFGTAAIIISIALALKSNQLVKNGVSATGRVVDVRERLEPVSTPRSSAGSETVYKKRYNSTIEFTTSGGAIVRFQQGNREELGKIMEILYDPAHPENARTKSFWWLWGPSTVLGLAGLVFAAIGFGGGYLVRRRRKEINWLLQYGTRLQARIIGINEESNHYRNTRGRSHTYRYWQIVAQYRDPGSGRSLSFTSDKLNRPPPDASVGRTVEVYVDPDDPSVHYLDVSSVRS
jgi:hypothetical protein